MQRCLGCMREFKSEYGLCPYCGYIVGTKPESAAHLPGGTRLAERYVVGRVLGHGGFGITYVAWDEKMERPVAIKEFFPNALSTRSQGEKAVSCYNEKSSRFFKDGVRKMLDEGKRLSRFQKNENIVDVYDYFEENNTAYIVMKYLEGKDLKKLLEEKGGRLGVEESIKLILPVLNALSVMHGENMIHRDVSPDNIFLCNNGRIYLLDFGSARLAVDDAEKSMSVMVKRGYAPKEQYLSRSKQGSWTDIYAVCATLYHLVTGETPTESADRELKPLKKLSEFGLTGCDEFEKILFKGLEPEIENRIKTCSELERKLKKALLSADKVQVRKPEEAVPEKPKKKQKHKRGKYPFAILILIAAVGITFGLMTALNKKEDKTEDITTALSGTTEAQTTVITTKPVDISVTTTLPTETTTLPESVMVPKFVGLNIEEAKALAESMFLNFEPDIKYENSEKDKDVVCKQYPPYGTVVEPGYTVSFVVSTGEKPDRVTVPKFVGMHLSDALKLADSLGLEVNPEIESEKSSKKKDYVCKQYPPYGTEVNIGYTVTFVISNGK